MKIAISRFRPADVVLVNLAPTAGSYRLIVAPASMLPVTATDRMQAGVRGWFRARLPMPEFLSADSKAGGTHHLAVTCAKDTKSFEAFGALTGWEVAAIA